MIVACSCITKEGLVAIDGPIAVASKTSIVDVGKALEHDGHSIQDSRCVGSPRGNLETLNSNGFDVWVSFDGETEDSSVARASTAKSFVEIRVLARVSRND